MPNATELAPGAAARASSTASTMVPRTSSRPPPRHSLRTRLRTDRSASIAAARSFVPPASTPITTSATMDGRYTQGAMSVPEPPEYKVYKSRSKLRDRLAPGRNPLEALRRRTRRTGPLPPGTRRTARRAVKWILIAAAGWILISIITFVISVATAPGESPGTELALGGGNLVTGSNILVLGSDLRAPGTKEPGAQTSGPSPSDSIMIVHAAFGSVRRLSILRDSLAPIPGHGEGRINSAYAIGGPPP